MWLLGLLTGVALTILILLQGLVILVRRLFDNPSPDWSRPGAIWDGSMARAQEVMENVFPEAPARSYLSIERFSDPALSYVRALVAQDTGGNDTKFFIRSVGKRGGQHRYRIELRLDATERARVDQALDLLRSVGPEVERTEKSYGAIVLTSEVAEDWRRLLSVGERFASEVLGGTKLRLCWHVAGRAGS